MQLTIDRVELTKKLEYSFRKKFCSYVEMYPEELYSDEGELNLLSEASKLHQSILTDLFIDLEIEVNEYSSFEESVLSLTNWNHKDYRSTMNEVIEHQNENKAMDEDIYSYNGISEYDFH